MLNQATGYCSEAGITSIVTDLVDVPALLVAVIVYVAVLGVINRSP